MRPYSDSKSGDTNKKSDGFYSQDIEIKRRMWKIKRIEWKCTILFSFSLIMLWFVIVHFFYIHKIYL